MTAANLKHAAIALAITCIAGTVFADEDAASAAQSAATSRRNVKRVLLLGQSPDGHPFSTHEYIADFVSLFGGCHGGPDRKFKVVTAKAELASPRHPVLRGIGPFEVREEFYYRLKFPRTRRTDFQSVGRRTDFQSVEGQPRPRIPNPSGVSRDDGLQIRPTAGSITPLIRVPIEGDTHTVAWAWTRPEGGRSFGFSGGHFHDNWKLPAYRRLMTQGIVWTLKLPVPEDGLPVDVSEKDLKLKPRGDANTN